MARGRRFTQTSASALNIAKADRLKKDRSSHDIGWPHFALVERIRGNCICTCIHCFGKAGCICTQCAGHNHTNCRYAHTCGEVDWCQGQSDNGLAVSA